ncbi:MULTISPECIES: hypothetical protein [unclassified Haladaptatus]|uniref:hypothetical protein n=1 Tax=unclassified Haladaptatus TaxID=2622732 RepID=UPI0023E81818|nr:MULTISPECIES: hypothetical protein [unclassified Haladaptatus]
MNIALQLLARRPLWVTVTFAVLCLVTIATAVPGYALGGEHVQAAVYALALGPAIVALGVFYAFSRPGDQTWFAVVATVSLAASIFGLFAGFLFVLGTTGPYVQPGIAGPNDVYLLADNAVQFLFPTAVLSFGAFLSTRVRRPGRRLVVLFLTGFSTVPAIVFAAIFVSRYLL